MSESVDIWRAIHDLRADLGRLRVADAGGSMLTYAQRVLNPFPLGSCGGALGDFAQSGEITLLAFFASVFVQTTNNGSNFWTLTLTNSAGATLASVSTAAASATTWTRLSDTTVTQPSSTNVVLAVFATATGSPGGIFIV